MNYEIKKDKTWLVREEERVYTAKCQGVLGRKRKRFRLIDVFAGAGGMTLGFSKLFGHAFDPVWANDFDDTRVRTYRRNFGDHCVSGDIVDILNDPNTEIPGSGFNRVVKRSYLSMERVGYDADYNYYQCPRCTFQEHPGIH